MKNTSPNPILKRIEERKRVKLKHKYPPKHTIFDASIKFMTTHTTLAISVIPIFAVFIGIAMESGVFEKFGLKLEHYVEITDLIMVVIKQPQSALVILVIMSAPIICFKVLLWFYMEAVKMIKGKYQNVYGTSFILAAASFPTIVPSFYLWNALIESRVNEIKNSDIVAQVTLRGKSRPDYYDVKVISSTDKYFFLYDASSPNETAIVVPVINISSIEYEKIEATADE